MTFPSTVNRVNHKRSNDEVYATSKYSIVESLRQGSSLTGHFDDVYYSREISNEKYGCEVPAKDRDRLSDREGKSASHIQEESKIGNEGESQREPVDGQQPSFLVNIRRL